MSSYKLVYFEGKGRGEVSRLIFAQAGVEYEDKRVSKEEWAQLKPTTPTGQLPLLEVDGKTLTGSRPINRFLAERFGLAGSNDLENAEIAGIIDLMEDFVMRLFPWFMEKDEAKKAELLKNISENEIPKYMGILEKRCAANNGNWIYGQKVTYADITIVGGYDFVVSFLPNLLEGRPALTKMKESVESLPNIARWLKERPKSEM